MARRKNIVNLALLLAVLFTFGVIIHRWQQQGEHQEQNYLQGLADDIENYKGSPSSGDGASRGEHESYIFAFGDSYTSFGFDSEGHVPTIQQPVGNRATSKSVPDQPSTYCLKWLDFLVDDLSPRHTLAFNYARGASTVDFALVPPEFWGAKPLAEQAKEWATTVGDRDHRMHMDWTGENSAFIIWFGINDVANTVEKEGVQYAPLYKKVVQSYLKTLDIFYAAGARRFVVLGVPPLERTPSLMEQGSPETVHVAAGTAVYNEILLSDTKAWRAEHSLASMHFIDTQPIFHRVLNSDATNAKCTLEQRPSCLWVDRFHPAVQLQRAVAEEVETVLRRGRLWS